MSTTLENRVPDFETTAIHGGFSGDPTTKARAVPIYQTTILPVQDTEHAAQAVRAEEFGNIYTRIMNPTSDVFEQRIAALEGGVAALALASGQAATIYSILNVARAGDHIVSSASLYGGTYSAFNHTLPKLGITVSLRRSGEDRDVRSGDHAEDEGDLRGDRSATRRSTSSISSRWPRWHTSIGVPADRRQYARDAVLASADRVGRRRRHPLGDEVHRRPRHLDRRDHRGLRQVRLGRVPASSPTSSIPIRPITASSYTAAFGNLAYIIKARVQLLRDMGAALSPFNSWLFLQGLETLALRMERHSQNAQRIAEYLAGAPKPRRGSPIPACRATLPMPAHRSTCRTGRARF